MGEASVTVPTNETLLVVDGHSLAFRAFFALPVDNFSTSSGQATNAVWGFATMLAQVIDAEKPDHLGVAFDVKGGTFRNEMLPQYKGTREAAPEELLTQLPLIQRMLTALGVTYIEKPGFEGDDVIATLATMGDKAGYHTLVLSGDRDAFQLVDDNVTVLYPGHHFKDLKHMTPQSIIDKYKVTPAQYPDLAALRGETADNIPGVPGVGDGFAAKWINQFGSSTAFASTPMKSAAKRRITAGQYRPGQTQSQSQRTGTRRRSRRRYRGSDIRHRGRGTDRRPVQGA